MTDDKITADADIAGTYLKALLARGVEHADAVSLTASYVNIRTMPEGQRAATDLAKVSRRVVHS